MITTIRRPASRSSFARSVSLGAALVFLLAPSVRAQSTAPGYYPAPGGGHYHEGVLGEQMLIVERSLKCNCSCGLDVHSCQFQMQCDVSPAWSARIRRDLEAGQTAEAVQAGFVADYGTQVLMAPPAEGFNLLGYFLPGVTILMAGALIGLFARGGMKREQFAPVPVSNEDEERLRAEWQKLDRSESPDW